MLEDLEPKDVADKAATKATSLIDASTIVVGTPKEDKNLGIEALYFKKDKIKKSKLGSNVHYLGSWGCL